MKHIAFYLSDHGFGHISRNIPIVKYLLSNWDVYIHLKCGIRQLEFAKSNLIGFENRITLYSENTDIGLILEEGKLDIDASKLKNAVENYINDWDKKVTKEIQFFKKHNIKCIVCDIVPWVLRAGKEFEIPSFLISNFTWVEIYEEYLEMDLCDVYLKYYKLADRVILYDLYNKKLENYFKDFKKVSLICREFNVSKAVEIKAKYAKPLVYVSVGLSVDLDITIDVSKTGYYYFVTEGINLFGDNVIKLPRDTLNTQDYILASDYVISKAGWSSAAEALLAGKRLALISRENIAEDRNTINILKQRKQCIEIELYDLIEISEVIKKMDEIDLVSLSGYKNCCKKICEEIIESI